MVWRLEKGAAHSHLVGAAHFFPYRFRRGLRRLIGKARIVLLEGPLDEAATRRVIAASRGAGGGALLAALDVPAKARLRARLGLVDVPLDAQQFLKKLIFGGEAQWLEEELRALRPWAAFFGIWARFRARQGWDHHLDVDAARIASALGRPVAYLETIDEQLAALEAVPLARFVHFLSAVDWQAYCAAYQRHYLAGDLPGLVAGAREFPTYCEPIIARRDPVLAARMAPEVERGGACVVIGVAHCAGVLAQLRDAGFHVTQCS